MTSITQDIKHRISINHLCPKTVLSKLLSSIKPTDNSSIEFLLATMASLNL